VGDQVLHSVGIHDEPASTYGQEDQKFPALIQPGETLSFNPILFEALKRVQDDDREYFRYKYMVLEDSFGKKDFTDIDEILFSLNIIKELKKDKRIFKPFTEAIKRRKFSKRITNFGRK
jgi:hypothetical protein